LSAEEIVELDLGDDIRASQWRDFAQEFVRPAWKDNLPESSEHLHDSDVLPPDAALYACGGGQNAFAINPYGGLSICILSQVDLYDLRRGSFSEGWEQFLARVRRKKATRLTKCTRCQLKSTCGMCPANAELENHDPEEPVDFLCKVAHLRAHSLGWSIPEHGSCEYCEGGAGYEEIVRSAKSLRAGDKPIRERRRSLAVVGGDSTTEGACSTGGCASCS
jgi:radical SAM protein with 4Fe4S-binding SPASM domain